MQTWMAFVMTLMTAWVPDECGVCNGSGVDADMDGICDDVDGVCWVFGCMRHLQRQCAVYAVFVVEGIADGACDCAGNVLDECGVCGGTALLKADM